MNTTRFGWICALALGGALLASHHGVEGVAQENAASKTATLDAKKLEALPERMREFVDKGEVSGVVALVALAGEGSREGHQWSVGLADIDANTPMQTDTLFAVASMTKPITAAAIMVLVDEGKLSLDDAVSKYLPEFKEQKLKSGEAPKTAVTLRHLLTHTSGLGGDQKNEGALAETAAMLARRPLDFEPGERWQYSPGLSVCGRVVEVVSGSPFDAFLEEKFFRPLGMSDTSFLPPKEKRSRIAKLYERKDGELKSITHWINELSDDRTPNPSGGLFSTAFDMSRFYQMMLNEGELDGKRVLSPEAVKEMTRVQTDDLKTGFTDGNGWGLGWCVVRKPQGVTEMLSPGTYGHGGAFGTQGWIDPERKMIFVLMIQRAGLPNADASEMRRTLQEIGVSALQ